ncbi:MAG: hypothetical protein A4E51_00759 [Methanosaeta sp. PtaU1.Bin055]|nr:MAG: hypothetical protein A4E51_00759 [Methanosaeta sp. PtaU1.Bin055]
MTSFFHPRLVLSPFAPDRLEEWAFLMGMTYSIIGAPPPRRPSTGLEEASWFHLEDAESRGIIGDVEAVAASPHKFATRIELVR